MGTNRTYKKGSAKYTNLGWRPTKHRNEQCDVTCHDLPNRSSYKGGAQLEIKNREDRNKGKHIMLEEWSI